MRESEANRTIQEARFNLKGQQSSRVLETLVARLKSQLTSKDKRIGQLKDAIRDLEKKLGDSFTQRSDASADAASTTSERAVVKAGVENKAAVLGAKLKRTQDNARGTPRPRNGSPSRRICAKAKPTGRFRKRGLT